MHKTHFRSAELTDAADACEVVRRSIRELCVLDHRNDERSLEAWLANKTPPWFERIISSDRSWSVVAVEGDAIRGFAQINDTGEVGLLYVDPEVRFRGISRQMLRFLEQQAVELKFRRLYLKSTRTAVQLYESEGFQRIGEAEIGLAGFEVYPMEKTLQPSHEAARSLRLEEPAILLIDSYRKLVREFSERGEPLVPFPLAFPNENPDEFFAELSACSRGEGSAAEWVPHSTYWLVSETGEVLGVSNLRHRLNERLRTEGGHIGYGVRPSARGMGYSRELLRLTVQQARTKGIRDVLITCAKTNERSVRTIRANGGILESEEFLPGRGEVVQRYWIRSEGQGGLRSDREGKHGTTGR